MAFDTRLSLKTWLLGQLPTGVGGVNATTILNSAISDAVGYAGTWVRDTQRADFVGDGVTARFALTGVDCALVDAPNQETPTGVATAATLTAPTAAPGATVLGSGGTIPAGLYYGAVAYKATIGGVTCYTAPSPYVTITVPSASSRITFTWTGPSISVDPTAGSQLYLSTGSGVADIRLSTATSGVTATATVSALPATSAAAPLVDYKELFVAYAPRKVLEQDIATDGTASVGVATLTCTTIPALGDRFRVVYDCKPAIPAADGDIIRVEQGEMRTIALAFAAKACSYVQEAGDTTLLSSLYSQTDALVMDMQKKAAPRLHVRPRMPDPRS